VPRKKKVPVAPMVPPPPRSPEVPLKPKHEKRFAEPDVVEGSMFSDVEFGPEAYVRLYRVDDMDKTNVFHGRFSTQECKEELIAKLFGGGTYRALLHERMETGKIWIRARKEFKVPGRYRPPNALPGVDGVLGEAGNATPPAGAVVPSGMSSGAVPEGTSPGQLLNMAMVSTVIDLLKMSREVAAPRNDNPMIALLQAQIKEQGDLLRAILTKAGETNPRAEFREMLTLVKDIALPVPAGTVPPSGAPSSVIKEMVEGVRMLRDLSDDVNPQRASDPLTDSLPKLVGIVEEGMRRGRERAAGPPARAALPAGSPPVPAFPEGAPEWFKVLSANRKKLVDAIQAGLSAESVAEFALKRLPPALGPAMSEFFALADAGVKAQEAIPELVNYPRWTEDFVESARELLGLEEGEEEDETIPEGLIPPVEGEA
jgi:hypothetical protein